MKNPYPKPPENRFKPVFISRVLKRATAFIVAVIFAATVPSALFAQAPAISYSTPQSYKLNSTITPLSPTSSGVAAPSYSATRIGRGSGYQAPFGVTIDASGNIYIADSSNGVVKEIKAGTNTPVVIASGFLFPTDVAVDAAGNVYVTDGEAYALKKIPAGGGSVVNVAGTIGWANGLAIDAKGNIFLAEMNGNTGLLAELKAGTSTVVALIPNLVLQGVTVDESGNVYFTDTGNSLVKELPANGGPVITVASGFTNPYGITVDAAGNLYVTDYGNGSIKEIPAGGGTPVAINTAFKQPTGIALDAAGNIYVSDPGNSTLLEIPRTGGYFLSPLLPAGLTFNNTTGVISGTPTEASPATNYTVTANNSSGHTSATVNLTVLTNNINLSHLTISAGTLTPAFATATRNYTDSVTNAVTSVKLTPTAGDPTETITVNGTTVASGSASSDIPLNLGANTITVIAKSSDGTIIDTYNLTVTRVPSSVATLSNLTISNGTLSPAFSTATTSYTDEVSSSTAGLTVTPTASDATATITVNGVAVASGTASANIPLSGGLNPINVVVTAQDGTTTDSYTISVTRPPAGLSVSYTGPQTYTVGVAITPLAPVSSGVAAFGYASPLTVGSGFNSPQQAVADAAGNIYVADDGNNVIKKIPAGGGTPVTIGPVFNHPDGVAVDPAGNVFVIDANGFVTKIPVGGGPVVTSHDQVGSGGIAIDAQGSVYVTFTNDPNGTVSKLPPDLQSSIIINDGGNFPIGVAVDNSYNVFMANAFADQYSPAIMESARYSAAPTGPASLFTSSIPTGGLAVDCAGNVFSTIYASTLPNLIEYLADGSAVVNFSTGFNRAAGLSIDMYGNIYVGDSGNNAVKEIKQTGGYYISGLPPGLKFDENTGIISGTPLAITPAGNYTITVYNSSGSATTTLNIKVVAPATPAINYSSPQNYYVGNAISPLAPATTGSVAAPAYAVPDYNLGYTPAITSSLLTNPTQPAMDAAGNLYIGAQSGATIFKVAAGGTTVTAFGTGFSAPVGVAADAAGNVFVADATLKKVFEIPVGGGAPTALIIGLTSPSRLAIDPAGNIYVLDNGVIKKYTGGGGTPVILGSSLQSPLDIGVDAAQNVYVISNNSIKKILASNGSIVTVTTGPFGCLSVDRAGDLFLGLNGYPGSVYEFFAAGGVAQIGGTISTFFFTGGTPPGPQFSGLVADNAGNVLLPQQGGIVEIKPIGGYYISGLPAGLTLNQTTGVINGTPLLPSPATDYTVTAYNITGNPGSTTVNIKVDTNPVTLTGLTLSSGPLSPSFSSTNGSYTAASVGLATTSVTVTPTANDPTETITVDGVTTPSGSASQPIPLAEGTNTITIIVKSHDGTISNTYSITMSRLPSTISTLSNIGVSIGTLSPAFASATTSYADSVAYAVNSITVTPTVSFPTATVKVNGTVVPSGSASGNIALHMGSNIISIVVTAEDGTTMATYTISVWRPYMTLAYTTPDVYMQSVPITPLVPQSLNVTAFAGFIGQPAPTFLRSSGIDSQMPSALAYDNNGFLYEVVGNNVEKVTTAGIVVLGSGFNAPGDIAVDAAGNVYVADSGNSAIKMIPVGGGPVVTLGSGFSGPHGVAVDGEGNVFVSDSGNNAVKEIPAGRGAVITLLSGLNKPLGIAVDQNDNLYIADVGDGKVLKLPQGSSTPIVLASQFDSSLSDIGVDAAGNVYAFASYFIWRIPADGGSRTIAYVEGFYDDISGFTVLPDGTFLTADLYIGVLHQTPYLTGAAPTGGYHISNFLPKGLTFSDVTGIISGTPAVSMPATNYTLAAYNRLSYVTTNVNLTIVPLGPPTFSYNSPNTYTQGMAISPLTPSGAVGVAPPGYSSTATTVGSGFLTPTGVAANGPGDVFVVDYGNHLVKKVPAGGGTPSIIGSGFTLPYGVAVDFAGNAYVADVGSNQVQKIAPGGAQTTVGSGFNDPVAVTVDGIGNVYVADAGNNAIKMIPVGGGSPVTMGSGFSNPQGVSVDAAGNVYVADYGNNAVKMIPVNGGPVVTLGSGFNQPKGIVVDNEGNLFVTEYSNNDLKEIPGGGTTVVLLSGFNHPVGVSFDGAGNLYIADSGNNAVKQFKPTGGYFIGPPLPPGLSMNSATGIISGTPTVTFPATDFMVTAYNSANSSQATTNIKTVASPVTLSNIVLSTGTLTPLFSSGINTYTVQVPNATSVIQLTPTASDPSFTITVNGVTVASGTPSANIALNAGANIVPVIVTSSDGTISNTYTVTVTRAPSADATLAHLTLSAGTLSPSFDPATTGYTALVDLGTTSITVTPTADELDAAITVNGVAVTSGSPSASIPLSVGPNTITIGVTAKDGITTDTYTVVVTRLSSEANLSNISLSTGVLSPAFVSGTTSYNAAVNTLTSVITLTPTSVDPNATITVNGATVLSGSASGNISLSPGPNVITTVVTAQNGITTKTYTVTVNRVAPSTNSQLFSIRTNPMQGTLVGVTGPGYLNYTEAVQNSLTSIQVIPTSKDPNASITVNGVPVVSGTASQDIPLAIGPNLITTVITAAVGSSSKTVYITVNRAGPSSNAEIKTITTTPKEATLVGVTGPGYLNYTEAVTYATTSIQVIAVTKEPAATLSVNGTPATSGSPSSPIALAIGPNVISTVITAPDGITTKTVIITVNRAGPSSNAQIKSIATNPYIDLIGSNYFIPPAYLSYYAQVRYYISSLVVTATAKDPNATLTINGTPVASGSPSAPIDVPIGNSTITIVITAQDGVTTKSVPISIYRATPPTDAGIFQTSSVVKPQETVSIENDGIVVHQAVSPNGDGVNDVFTIDGLANYRENKVTIIDRNGILVYEAKSYDNSSVVFDGHSNVNGKMQAPGTYFYSLEYKAGDVTKHQTGYIILKY